MKPKDIVYTLNCDKCGVHYQSDDGFPEPQVCNSCAAFMARIRDLEADLRESQERLTDLTELKNKEK